MSIVFLTLLALPPAAAQTATLPVIVPPRVIVPGVLRANTVAPPACLSGAIIGEEGSSAVIGEKGSGAIIGEKGSEGIIGEKGSKAYGNRWSATQFTRFNHVLAGRPGKRNLSLYGCSSASGGETVAVYLAGANGERKTGWRHFVIATRNGNSRVGSITLPPAAKGQTVSRLPIVVVVENASGKPNVGEYRLELVD